MKIIYLNVEHGKLGSKLLGFISSQSLTTDTFCFQEADTATFNTIEKLLPDFVGYRMEKFVPKIGLYCIANFVNKRYLVKSRTRILNGEADIGISEALLTKFNVPEVLIANVHGISQPGDKKDNPGRIKQCTEILNFVSKFETPIIIGGDFNLLPDTKSIKLFEDEGYRNLVKDFGIKTTRTKNAWKIALKNNRKGHLFYEKQNFADYVFVSPSVKVNKFEVPQIEVSDHLPLILDFEI